jgi:hypothetical protein
VRIPDCLGFYWFGGGNISSASPVQCARLVALYEQYLGELKDAERIQAEGFLAYRIGRTSQLYGDNTKAQSNLMIALFSPISIVYRAKAFYLLTRNTLSRMLS